MAMQTDSGTGGSNALRPISIRQLNEGMVVQDNIYDSGGDRLLLHAGNTLDADQIDRMKRLNGGSDTIYVTGRMYNAIVSKRPNIKIEKREDVENTTGYASALTRVLRLYDDIAVNNKVSRDKFLGVADDLSQLVKTTSPGITMSLINTIVPGDDFVQRHLINVALLNGLLGLWLGLPDEQIDKLVLVGLMHDCGLALMPPNVLRAPRQFTRIESEVIKMHTIRTNELLASFDDDIRLTAGTHHERIDGSGYPDGISGDAVTGATRITTISDIYEAIVSVRAHREPKSPFFAMSLFGDIAPEQIDSNVVNTLIENLPPLLMGKPVTMSDGTIGIIQEIDPKDIEYPIVEVSGHEIKTNSKLHCVSMYNDE